VLKREKRKEANDHQIVSQMSSTLPLIILTGALNDTSCTEFQNLHALSSLIL
jgi:hypothetical protein